MAGLYKREPPGSELRDKLISRITTPWIFENKL